MKPFFRWHTDEDVAWEGERPFPHHARQRKTRRLAIWFIGMLVAGTALVYWQQIRQIQLEERQIQADVLASHQTWQEAVGGADFDLFVYLLSKQDPLWQNGQKQLFTQGLMRDRAPLGLYAQAEPDNIVVELAPDWQVATVTFEQTYTAVANAETTDIIRLQQTSLYQLDGSRWLQMPPDAEFWGETAIYEGKWLTLLYPARDAEWALRLAADLEDELAAICATKPCRNGVDVRLATEPGALAGLRDVLTPVFDGRFHILPTFTLAGLPLDDAGYRALYQGYTLRILTAFENSLDSPVPLPEQAIQTICFADGGNTPHLFRYDLTSDAWTTELPDRAFRFLTPSYDDNGVILTELPASSEPNRLQLSLWQNGRETPLVDDASRQWRFPPLGWSEQAQPPRAMLYEFDTTTQTRTLYSWLDMEQCDEAGCAVQDLPGYTVWSPDGRFTLIVIDSELWLGDEQGEPSQVVGPGTTPFWLDNETYGYIRYQPQMELVAATVNEGSERVLLDSVMVTAVLNDSETGFPSISFVAPHSTTPNLLFLTGPEIRGATGKYNIFSFQVADDWLKTPTGQAAGTLILRLQLDEPPLGYPSRLTPSGAPPISFSENGRWLVTAQLPNPPNDIWNISLYDITANQTQIINVRSPQYQANAPFFDWSRDGQWLVVVDDGFFRLIAPAVNYERLILHEFEECYFTAWVN